MSSSRAWSGISKGSSRPRERTWVSYVSCIGRQVLYTRATCEALLCINKHIFSCRYIKTFLFLFSFFFNWKLITLNVVLVLPYINMNPPWVYTCSQSWTPSYLPPHTISLGHPSAPAPSILYPALNLDWRFVSCMILYMFQCHSPKSSHPRPFPQSPKDCSIHLCLFCCLAYRIIITIFLNSIYMC